MQDGQSATTLREDLRSALLPWLMAPVIAASYVLFLTDHVYAPPPSPTGAAMLLMALIGSAWALRRWSHSVAAWLFSLGSVIMTALVAVWLPESGAQHLMAYPVIAASIALSPSAGVVVAAASTLTSLILFRAPEGAFALVGHSWMVIVAVWATAYLMYVAQQPEKTMLAWAWQGYERARHHLEQARDRQVELKQTLDDLALANREITRLNDLLQAAREAVEEARRAKEEFVANVSHELRTPLNMIIGFSDEILERPEVYSVSLPDALLRDVASIKRNSEHLAHLVDDVLDLVEADVGFTRLSREWASLRDVILQARDAVAGFFDKKQLQLDVVIPEDLPPICCDHHRVRQVLLNVLSNAARFTQEGGARVEAMAHEGAIVIRVSDTGPGIDPSVAQRLFEPFQQADPSIRRRYGGTGLGLAISKRFIELHGGRIWIESTVGAGTTVSFSLPLEAEEPRPTPKRWINPYQEYEPRTRPSMAPQSSPRPRAIVVEEGRSLSDLVRHYLDGLEVGTCRSVTEAREAIEREPAVALLVNQMLTEGLFGLMGELASMPFDVPIIACWVPERDAVVEQMGVQGYLTKPIRRVELSDAVERAAPEAKRILLVEDDSEAKQLFERMLSTDSTRYTIRHAGDGEAALEAMRTWRPDLVLLDLVMPGQDGFEVLAARLEDPALLSIPVVIVSARDPRREPIMSNGLMLTRPLGLSARDLMLAVGAIVGALPPRFGALARRETPAPS